MSCRAVGFFIEIKDFEDAANLGGFIEEKKEKKCSLYI